MPNRLIDSTARAQDAVLSAVEQAQDAVVSAVETVTGLVGGFIPELPTRSFAAYIPAPREIADQTFSFATKLIDAQREYTASLLTALEPVTTKVLGSNGKSKRTAKTTAKAPVDA